MNYDYGSMWRKWDLHIHSPYSVLNNGDLGDGFSNQGDELERIMEKYVYEIFTRAIDNDVHCIGITDYFVIEGYKKVKSIICNEIRMKVIFNSELEKDKDYLEKVSRILVLPNIEFRLDTTVNIVKGDTAKSSKMQAHVIFSDSIDPTTIQDSFLSVLQFKDVNQRKNNLTISSLKSHGKSLKESGVGGEGSDLFVGMNGAQISIDDLKDLISTNFKNEAIIVLAEEDQSQINWSSQAGSLRRKVYSLSDAIFSSNKSTIVWGLGEECKNTIGHKLTSLWGSDAHSFEKMFLPDNDKHCWIKADNTFDGLLHALEVADNRIYIGKFPPQLQSYLDRSAYTIKKIRINKNKESESRIWFDTEIPINPFMVTIIGNKGSGKSALSDIIGYIGNSHNMNMASFLDSKRFLDKKTRYGDEYQAQIDFYSGKDNVIIKERLEQSFQSDVPERVKYLPQRYIEEVCNDITDVFQKEINNTIFSYVPLQDKIGATNIDELIEFKTESLNTQINDKKNALREINERVVNLENKRKVQHINNVRNLLAESKVKLANHIDNKPVAVPKPDDIERNTFAQQTIQINKLVNEIKSECDTLTNELKNINILIQKIVDFKDELKMFKNIKENIDQRYNDVAEVLNINKREFVSVKYNDDELKSKESELIESKIKLTKKLDESRIELVTLPIPNLDVSVEEIISEITKYHSLYEKVYILKEYLTHISKNITNSQQLYFEYEVKVKKWAEMKDMLEGVIDNTENEFSIKKYEKELDSLLNQLPKDLEQVKKNRLSIIEEIVNLKIEKIKVLESIYKPVQNRITSIEGLKASKIVFNTTLKVDTNLVDMLLNYIDSRAEGRFRGAKDGRLFLVDMVESTNFNDQKDIVKFINAIYEETTTNIDNVDTLLKDRVEFNNYLGGLSYLDAIFTIEAEGKKMNELSPGERGIVLLIFYLALSKGNMPLIIDQPEDNLDNQSVFTKLVPAIVEAKKNRQIIVVTHNPNIAVACDSEQIVYCEIEETSKTLIYRPGSIENPTIKKNIIDILEGTKPAFDRRRITYKS